MSRTYLRLRAFVLSLCLVGMGVLLHRRLSEAERTGDGTSIHLVLAFAYDVGGKWGVMLTWAAFSVFFVFLSLRWTGEEPGERHDR